MSNPYRIEGPALISFSGGRTSGYMLWHILDAYDGKLPDDVHVCFANTGKEREETLRFVNECESRWGVRIRWLEWRSRLKSVPVSERFAEVGYGDAARAGEPFETLIKSKGITPNGLMRFCTEELKVSVLECFMVALGYARWANVIGLRADEMRRVAKQDRKNDEGSRSWVSVMPMVKSRVTKADVLAFWGKQPFDLELQGWEGNCDLCFLKGPRILKRIIRDHPASAEWWSRIEQTIGKGNFTTEYSYADLARDVAESPLLPLEPDDAEFDAECGVSGTDTRIRCGAKKAA